MSNQIKKYYVLDTNILLQDPNSIFSFQDNYIILPFAVIEELDNIKKEQSEVGRNARFVSKKLDELRQFGNLADGVNLPNGGILKIELNNSTIPNFDSGKFDNRILAVAYNLNKLINKNVVLVTNDLNLRIKADTLKVEAQSYHKDVVDHDKLYEENRTLFLESADIDKFYKNKKLECPVEAYANEFFLLKSINESNHTGLARYINGFLYPLKYENEVPYDLIPKNKEQKFAMELLMDPDIKIVTLIGYAGTGKTLISLAAGLELVTNQDLYSKLLVTRPVVPMGQDIGYLKGTKEEKLRPWMQPIYDNMEFLFSKNNSKKRAVQLVDELIDFGQIELECLTYIRGRSIPNQFIICDESQNITYHMIKTLLTRVGEGTKIVLTGDPDQIDNPYIDSTNNGLSLLVNKLKGVDFAGHVTLLKGERSKVAELCAKIL
jgi:PhoH-like ATPase